VKLHIYFPITLHTRKKKQQRLRSTHQNLPTKENGGKVTINLGFQPLTQSQPEIYVHNHTESKYLYMKNQVKSKLYIYIK
jgi:hypothetical protein